MNHHHRGKRSIKDSIVQIKKDLLDYVTFASREPPPTKPPPPTYTSFSNTCIRQYGLRSAGLNTINSKTDDKTIRQRCAGEICAAPQPKGILAYRHKLSLSCAKTTLDCVKSLNTSPDSGIGSMEVEYDSDSGRFSSEETDSEMSDVDWTDDESDDESDSSPPSDSKLLNMFSIPFSDLPFVKEEYRRSEISRINSGYSISSITAIASTEMCTCSSTDVTVKITKKVQFCNNPRVATWLYF